MIKDRLFILLIFLFGVLDLSGQEILANVSVSAPLNTTVDKSIYQSMEKSMIELLNNTNWTNDNFEPHERIECNFQLTITAETSATSFEGELIIQSSRPIYNSIYNSPIFNHIDKHIFFTFVDQQVLQKSDEGYVDNLSSIISYYAYIMLGLDYDTFSLYGGEENFQRAQNVMNNLSSGLKSDPGWTLEGLTKNNRYWILENILNSRFKPFRQAYYEYHRLGLDDMIEEPDRKRAIMSSAITAIGDVNKEVQNSILLQIFANTKRQEIVDVYAVDQRGPKNKIRSIMVSIDPANANKYEQLKR